VILHLRYTAREAGDPLDSQATRELIAMFDTMGQAGQALLFCLRYDFATEWSAFVNGSLNFQVVLQKIYFPYFAQSAKRITVDSVTTYAAYNGKVASVQQQAVDLDNLSASLNQTGSATLSLQQDNQVVTPVLSQQVYLVLNYHFGNS
jgi:hypothetical protein